jgi:hypothetical protein
MVDGSLPVLPHEVGETVDCSAVARRVGRRMMLALPFRAGFGPSRGRRYRVAVNGVRTGSHLVMVVDGQAMVPVPAGSLTEGDVVEVTLRVLAQRPTPRVPADFASALTAAGLGVDLGVDVIADHELNQLVTMVREADDPAVRRGRIENAVAAVAELIAVRAKDADGH